MGYNCGTNADIASNPTHRVKVNILITSDLSETMAPNQALRADDLLVQFNSVLEVFEIVQTALIQHHATVAKIAQLAHLVADHDRA